MQETTFIVGAGASTDFGLPIGRTLAGIIGQMLADELSANPRDGEQPILRAAMRSGEHGDFGAAAQDIAGGMIAARSIDRFLHSRQGRPLVERVGKCAISEAIARAERTSRLGGVDETDWAAVRGALLATNDSWLARLFSLLQEGVRPEDADKIFESVRFVVFNYDRCIERYLQLALAHVMQQTVGKSAELVQQIPLVHVYGSLGELKSPGQQVPFGADEFHLPMMAAGIRTFTEAAKEDVLARAHTLLRESDRIVFLGFAFDPLNVQALFPEPLGAHQHIMATSMGLGPVERNSFISGALGGREASARFYDMTAGSLLGINDFREFLAI